MKRLLRQIRRKVNQALGRDLRFSVQMRCPTLRLGSEYGGWVVRPDLITADAIVYCFGVGEDVSFDVSLIDKFGVMVHAFDPTPKARRWIASQNLPAQFIFHNVGLADFDGATRFVLPRADFASYHIGSESEHGADTVECAVQRLTTIMAGLRHDRIDVLKMDIEGAEYAALTDIVRSRISIRQLLVEFHHTAGDRPSLEKTKQAVQMLQGAGYRIFDVSPGGMEYSFTL